MGFGQAGWSSLDQRSWSELSRMQDDRLHRFVNEQLYPFSPFYRRLFDEHKIDPRKIRSVSDLRHVPLTCKADLAPTKDNPARPLEFILSPTRERIESHWPAHRKLGMLCKTIFRGDDAVKEDLDFEYRPIFFTATTGRSAAPTSFFYTARDIKNLEISGGRMLGLLDISREDRGLSLMPFAPHLAFWQVVFGAVANGIMCVSTGGGKVLGTRGIIHLIQRIKPTFLIGIPGYTYHLLRSAKDEGADFSSVKIVGLGAERVPPGLKERMSELLVGMGAKEPKVVGTYAFTEARVAWGECPTALTVSSGYHTYPDMEVVEVVDPKTGEPVGEGEPGELVYSSIDGRGSVVFRYRTGDLLAQGVTYAPCPHCGRRTPRITSNIARVSNVKDMQISKIKGTLVNLNNLGQLLMDCKDVEEWQVEIRKKGDDPLEMDELFVYVSTRTGTDGGSLCANLRKRMVEEAEVAPNDIKVLPLPDLLSRLGMETELKERRIVDARPKA